MVKKFSSLFFWKLTLRIARAISILRLLFGRFVFLILGIPALPIFLYSCIKNRIIYLLLKNNLSASLFNKLPSSLAARVLYRNSSSAINKAKIVSSLYKSTAWSILLELEKINKVSFLEILECLDTSTLNSLLFLESMSRRKSILFALGRKENLIDKEDFVDSEKIMSNLDEVEYDT